MSGNDRVSCQSLPNPSIDNAIPTKLSMGECVCVHAFMST